MKIVIDSCTVILLAKASVLSKVLESYQVIVTKDVFNEIMKGKERKFSDALLIEKFVKEGKIIESKVSNQLMNKIMKDFNMGKGEASVIAYGIKNNVIVGTDNKQGRNAAKINDLKLVGSIEITVKLFKNKKIDYNKATGALRILMEEGWFDNYLIEKAMEDIKND